MMLEKLCPTFVDKPWGVARLPAPFGAVDDRRIGEIWYEALSGACEALPLMAKYIFTSQCLSVQVHPDDKAARAMGFSCGKTEAWYIVDCQPGATIGLGLKTPLSQDMFRAAAISGAIMDLIAWIPVSVGDFIYVPAGTIHAIGAGISLVEIQTNIDLTFRIYDHGRPRPLHLDDAIRVSMLDSYAGTTIPTYDGENIALTPAHESPFQVQLQNWRSAEDAAFVADRPILFIPLEGNGMINGRPWTAGEGWTATGDVRITAMSRAKALMATPG